MQAPLQRLASLVAERALCMSSREACSALFALGKLQLRHPAAMLALTARLEDTLHEANTWSLTNALMGMAYLGKYMTTHT